MLQAARADHQIYLSPHYDDIAFSLGAWVATTPGGLLVNLFTRSGYVAGTPTDHWPDVATIDRVMVLRRAEDTSFSERYQLERLDLGLEEPPVRKRTPWDLAGLVEDIEQVRAPLTGLLGSLTPGARIFCPAGIGGHVNHLAVRAVVVDLLPALVGHTEVLFYEDLPYAASRRVRRRGLADLHLALHGRQLRRQTWASNFQKLAAVNCYPSQLPKPASLRRFSPRTLWPIGPHEAVWRVVTTS